MHAANPDPDKSAAKGDLPEPWLVETVHSDGFSREARSDLNANLKDTKDTRDTKDYEQGVWTLPPSLARGDEDRDRYLAIAKSDRSTLKFVKVTRQRPTAPRARGPEPPRVAGALHSRRAPPGVRGPLPHGTPVARRVLTPHRR